MILTFIVLAVIFLSLLFTRLPTDVVLLGGLTVLLVGGVVTAREAFAGFSNEGVITVAVLYVVAAGLRESGGISVLAAPFFRRPGTITGAQARLMAPVAVISAFLNNTPLVVMLMPVVNDWARKFRMPASKLLIPLSYASILGGLCTMIGTSTNLIVHGLMLDAGMPGYRLFDLAWVGLPCAVVGIGFIMLTSHWLLPDRRPAVSTNDDPREYALEMMVEPGSPLSGRTIEEAGLRHLQGLYLMEIDRNGQVIAAVGPEEKLQDGDRLIFVGVVDSIVDLQRIRGLVPATNQVFKLTDPRRERVLIEAVVSHSSPVVGKSIREGRFRTRYDAAVIAVARGGERLRQKVGDIVLQPGDTLLLETLPSFFDQQRNSRDFYLISRIEDYTPQRRDRAMVALGILAAIVACVTTGLLSMLEAALLGGGVMLATGCVTIEAARRSIDWRVLASIGAAVGLGQALEVSGAAQQVASSLLGFAGSTPLVTLIVVYAATMLFTELITNNAAAVLMFPIAMASAAGIGANPLPFIVAVTVAASCGFATPLGYQTHLIVYGPGGYRFTDFLRIGVPMNLIVMAVALTVIPRVWPLVPTP
jgi:di/tricarboxylate transporter